MKRSPIKRKRRRPKPGDDPKYLKWIREQPCVVCEVEQGERPWIVDGFLRRIIDPAHFHDGTQGWGLKARDASTLPVCRWHHQHAPDAHHILGSDELFEKAHGINIGELIAEHRARYESEE